MVRLSAIIISLFLVFSFQAQAKSPPPGTGTSDIPANILIMLDNSGSMSAKLYNAVEVYYPLDIATDSSGNVYVMEYYNNRIKVFNSSGAYLRSFGGYGMDVINGNMLDNLQFIMINLYCRYLWSKGKKSYSNGSMFKEVLRFQLSSCNSCKQQLCFVGYPGNGIYV